MCVYITTLFIECDVRLTFISINFSIRLRKTMLIVILFFFCNFVEVYHLLKAFQYRGAIKHSEHISMVFEVDLKLIQHYFHWNLLFF